MMMMMMMEWLANDDDDDGDDGMEQGEVGSRMWEELKAAMVIVLCVVDVVGGCRPCWAIDGAADGFDGGVVVAGAVLKYDRVDRFRH